MSDLQYDFGDDKEGMNSLKHSGKTAQLEELLMTSGLSGEVQPAEAMCDLVENEYTKDF